MRLIDADELIKDIDYSADMGGALGKVVECAKYYAKFMVASAPTIEERKTGKWIHQKYHCDDPDGETIFVEFVSCECSECGLYVQQPCNFCPNCGAKMERTQP